METIRCAVWLGGREFGIEARPLPQPGAGEVRVRVHACGVCLTEVHLIDGLQHAAQPPRVFGHEIGGVIDAVGPEVIGLAAGMPVVCAGQGGFAEQILRPAEWVFPLPAGVAVERAAQAEPLLCCLAAVKKAELRPGATVLITGVGPIGLMLLQLARNAGAAQVIVSEPAAARRTLALQLGAAAALDPREAPLPAAVHALTGGRGVAVAFETAGVSAALADCLAATAEEGLVVMVGVHAAADRLTIEPYLFHRRNLTLRASYGATAGIGFGTATQALSQIDLEALISHRFDLADITQAFEVARSGGGLKVLVGAGLGAAGDR
ncbi:MAG: zinc-binding dehydrogenase [Anaerolineales bacterium]|nr:zinc-binding dehydrogenase [Anaerolineales bacterium]